MFLLLFLLIESSYLDRVTALEAEDTNKDDAMYNLLKSLTEETTDLTTFLKVRGGVFHIPPPGFADSPRSELQTAGSRSIHGASEAYPGASRETLKPFLTNTPCNHSAGSPFGKAKFKMYLHSKKLKKG